MDFVETIRNVSLSKGIFIPYNEKGVSQNKEDKGGKVHERAQRRKGRCAG
ncbi:hypothetical protein SDC9_54220 [bioreactor metagenome]|uniref:Uncharacterized protein n=1 Tax=bioreactor metagenome TaxID=1076179 RepID=A0A644WVU8_9ZZZZ